MKKRNLHPVEPDRNTSARDTEASLHLMSTLEEAIETIVGRAVARALAAHRNSGTPQPPLVLTVPQAAESLQVSPHTITRLIKAGLLTKVPNIDGKTLIPRASIERLVAGRPINSETAAGGVTVLRTSAR